MGHDMAILPLSGGPPVLMATIVINQNAAHGPVVKPNMVVSPDGFNADISVRNCEQSSHKKHQSTGELDFSQQLWLLDPA
jgi:hypothetical protein